MSDNPERPSQPDDRSKSPLEPDDLCYKPSQVASSPIEIKPSTNANQTSLDARQSPPISGSFTDPNGEPIPIDRIIKTANTMSTMMMAHKIALEDDFRLEPGMDISGPLMNLSPIIGSSPSRGLTTGGQAEPSLQTKVKDIVHEVYWDLFKEELASQNNENVQERKFDISKQLLRDIRQKIIDLLLPQHTRLKLEIEDKLDSKVIDQLSQVESLDLVQYAKYILEVLSKLCAPIRDEKLKQLVDTTDTVQLYRGIMELLEMMRLDFANFTLNKFKPHIKAHSQEYEREKFNEILKQQRTIGIDGLEFTRVWLKRAVERVEELYGVSDLVNNPGGQSNMESGDLSGSILTSNSASGSSSEGGCSDNKKDRILRSDIVDKVLNIGYCELLDWSTDKQKLYPETLLFDEATFRALGEQYRVLVLTSSILLTLFAFLSQFKLNDNYDLKVLAKSHVITLLTATYDGLTSDGSSPADRLCREKLETIAMKLHEDIKEKLTETCSEQLDNLERQREIFKRQILDLHNPTNRVRELAMRRILEFIETLLALDVDHQRKKFSAKMAPPVNIPLGLNCLTDEITLTMAQLVKIIRYNRRVFFEHYQDIIIDFVVGYL